MSGVHTPPVHRPEQQSALTVHFPEVGVQAKSQRPFKQKLVQQSALVVQAPAMGVHAVGGGPQTPPTQENPQQSASCVQALPSAAHGV